MKKFNISDFPVKFAWWVRDHLYLSRNYLEGAEELTYDLPEGYGDFAVHPCVRYIPEGLGGYDWWMALTPYQDYDETRENILLYCGVSASAGKPPSSWKYVREVCGTHPKGFNSDPNLVYFEERLWIIWREWGTENLPDGCDLCCIRCCTTEDGENFSDPMTVALNVYDVPGTEGDTTMCPCVDYDSDGLYMYGSVYQYKPHLKPRGISRYKWNGEVFADPAITLNRNIQFDLWHFDLFREGGYLYQLVTGQFGNAILIGRSSDGVDFKYSGRPLLCNPFFLKKNYFYKASAQVAGGTLYVFFPRKRPSGKLRISMMSMPAGYLDTKFRYTK